MGLAGGSPRAGVSPRDRHAALGSGPQSAGRRPDFAGFGEAGYVKIATAFRVDPVGESASVFRLETRMIATDPKSRAREAASGSTLPQAGAAEL